MRLALFAACFCAATAALPAQPATKPNVVFILADDLGWGDLGCYGNAQIKTPNVDQLAKDGILFTDFTTASPVCSPSRAAFLSGRYPARLRIHTALADSRSNQANSCADAMDPQTATLTRSFQAAGYRVGHFGKWHLGGGVDKSVPPPSDYGIDEALTTNSAGPPLPLVPDPGEHPRSVSSREIVSAGISFIEKDPSRPFLLNLWMHTPHAPVYPSKAQKEVYPELMPFGKEWTKIRDRYHLDPVTTPQLLYFSDITEMDRQIGRLREWLRSHGLLENTIVIFSSDNGPEDIEVVNSRHSANGSAGLFRGRKRSIYEGGIRVPFIVSWPAGQTRKGLVDHTSVINAVDLLPTLLACANIPQVPGAREGDGINMKNAFLGEPQTRNKPLFWEWRFAIGGHPMNTSPVWAMRENQWKLLLNPDGSRAELYDLRETPAEIDNVADRYPDRVQTMSRALRDWAATLPDENALPPKAGASQSPYLRLFAGEPPAQTPKTPARTQD